jgi:hypothetical protein
MKHLLTLANDDVPLERLSGERVGIDEGKIKKEIKQTVPNKGFQFSDHYTAPFH